MASIKYRSFRATSSPILGRWTSCSRLGRGNCRSSRAAQRGRTGSRSKRSPSWSASIWAPSSTCLPRIGATHRSGPGRLRALLRPVPRGASRRSAAWPSAVVRPARLAPLQRGGRLPGARAGHPAVDRVLQSGASARDDAARDPGVRRRCPAPVRCLVAGCEGEDGLGRQGQRLLRRREPARVPRAHHLACGPALPPAHVDSGGQVPDRPRPTYSSRHVDRPAHAREGLGR